MARFLVNGDWYHELSVNSLYEYEYENNFLQQAQLIFPDYFAIKFKAPVESHYYGNGKADLALIEKNYQHWYVIEIEKSSHSLSHVLNQVSIFSNAEYDERTAKALKKECEDLDFEKLNIMIKGQQPRVLVVVDVLKEDWIRSLKKYDADLAVFQIFRARNNKQVFRLNGFSPKPLESQFSECYFEKIFKRNLIILSPAIIEEPNHGILVLNFYDTISEWKRMDLKNQIQLCPLSKNPLDSSQKYRLYKKKNNEYLITLKT